MDPRFSFSTHFFVYRTLDDEALDLIAGEGFAQVELWGMLPHLPYRDDGFVARLGEALAARGLRATSAHLPIYRHRTDALERGEFIGLGHPERRIREAAREEMAACLPPLIHLGVGQVVAHADLHPEAEAKSEGLLLDGVAWLLDRFPGRVALENILWETAHPLPLGRLVERFRARLGAEGARLGGCIDVGHAAATGTLDDSLAALAGKVFELHLSDTRPPKDEHLIPGEGALNWDEACGIIRGMRVDGPLVMEIRAREPYPETVAAIGRAAADLAARCLP
jgi:sugar phosphate isomerase/epimerase